MTTWATLHRVPRYPHAWAWLLLGSQLGVAAVWWRFGWQLGLPLMLATHLLFWTGVLVPQSALFSPVLSRLPIDKQQVWLTIDDGPSDETEALLALLDQYGAKATFFLVAARAAARPELVQEIVRRGHDIGNHSLSHPQGWFWALGPQRMSTQIDQAQLILTQHSGHPPRWFRAVVGMANPFVSAPLKRHGLARVAWSVRGFDGVNVEPEKAIARIIVGLKPGAIVLLHEGATHGHNPTIVRGVLEAMREHGYTSILPDPTPPPFPVGAT